MSQPGWYALWTQSHCEQLVHDQLRAKGLVAFLPTMRRWSRRSGVRRLIPVPMFPGYLFVQDVMDKNAYLEIVKTRGLVRILGERWDRLSPVPDDEVEALRRIVAADVEVMPHAYLREGDRVRVDAGFLAGLEGILIRTKPKRGLFVLSVELLHRSVAVEVDCTLVSPLNATGSLARIAAPAFAAEAAAL
jgi:transcription antitermination factor NusG